jgi:two-component system response regulator YesN
MHNENQTYEAWQQETWQTSPSFGKCSAHTVVYLRGNTDAPKTLKLVEFVYSFYPYDHNDGYAVLFVKQDVLLDMIGQTDTSEGSVLILDEQGTLIASRMADDADIGSLQTALGEMQGNIVSTQQVIDGKNMFLTQATSSTTGLRIAIALSADAVFARLTTLRAIIFWTLCLAFMVGGLLCYILSTRNARFVRNIAREGGEYLLHMSYTKALRSLQTSFADFQMNNESMNSMLEQQKPYLQYTFLSRLIKGDFRSEEEAVVMAKTTGVYKQKQKRCVVLFRLYSGASSGDTLTLQLAANCKAVIKLSLEMLEPQAFFTDKSEEEFVLLLEGDNLRERIDALIGMIRSKLPDNVNEMMFVYVGNTVELLTDVVRSYGNAASLIYIKPSPDENHAVFYDATENPKYVLFYPQDVQHHLMDYAMTGDETGMLNLLSLLKERNFSEANMPSFMRQLFINNLLNTLLQITTLSGLPSNETEMICERIKELMGLALNAQIQQIDQLFLLLCQAVQRQKSGKQQSMIEGVIAYIHTCYSDCDLSLTHVAERFDVSESYLSYAFKMQSGTNFFNFVESIRMAKAKELLKQTSFKIGEIAAQVGYTSANSFCRAFKRNTGDNASTYRNGVE